MDRMRAGGLPIRAGLIGGSAAAMAGSLANLPLHSPSDAFFNSASVMVGALAVGLGAGVLWSFLGSSLGRFFGHDPAGEAHRQTIFGACIALAFGLVSVIALIGETQLERSVSYVVPLAAVVLGITGSLTLLLLRSPQILLWRLTVLMIIAAIGIGIGLAGQGDQKSGGLELPPRAAAKAVWGLSS